MSPDPYIQTLVLFPSPSHALRTSSLSAKLSTADAKACCPRAGKRDASADATREIQSASSCSDPIFDQKCPLSSRTMFVSNEFTPRLGCRVRISQATKSYNQASRLTRGPCSS